MFLFSDFDVFDGFDGFDGLLFSCFDVFIFSTGISKRVRTHIIGYNVEDIKTTAVKRYCF